MKLYRFMSADDTPVFCHKVTADLNRSWELHGSPSHASGPFHWVMRCGQSMVKEVPGDCHPDAKLSAL